MHVDGAAAGERGQKAIGGPLQVMAARLERQLGHHGGHDRTDLAQVQQRRHPPHRQTLVAEGIDLKTGRLPLRSLLQDPRQFMGFEIDHDRFQQML